MYDMDWFLSREMRDFLAPFLTAGLGGNDMSDRSRSCLGEPVHVYNGEVICCVGVGAEVDPLRPALCSAIVHHLFPLFNQLEKLLFIEDCDSQLLGFG